SSACKGTESPIPEEKKPDEKEPKKEEPAAIVPPVTNLKAEKTEKANELHITWTYPDEAVSTEITYVLEGADPSDAVKKNIMKPTGDNGLLAIYVLQHGKYIISAVAVDKKGNRSEKVTTSGTP